MFLLVALTSGPICKLLLAAWISQKRLVGGDASSSALCNFAVAAMCIYYHLLYPAVKVQLFFCECLACKKKRCNLGCWCDVSKALLVCSSLQLACDFWCLDALHMFAGLLSLPHRLLLDAVAPKCMELNQATDFAWQDWLCMKSVGTS